MEDGINKKANVLWIGMVLFLQKVDNH